MNSTPQTQASASAATQRAQPSPDFIAREDFATDLPPAPVFAAQFLLIVGGISTVEGFKSPWAFAVATAAFLAAGFVMYRWKISSRALFRIRFGREELRKLK